MDSALLIIAKITRASNSSNAPTNSQIIATQHSLVQFTKTATLVNGDILNDPS